MNSGTSIVSTNCHMMTSSSSRQKTIFGRSTIYECARVYHEQLPHAACLHIMQPEVTLGGLGFWWIYDLATQQHRSAKVEETHAVDSEQRHMNCTAYFLFLNTSIYAILISKFYNIRFYSMFQMSILLFMAK